MFTRSSLFVLASSVCLALALTAGGRPAPDKAVSAPMDATGDSLPPGVLARLGTARLFPPSSTNLLAFSPDDTILASASGARTCTLWEVSTGKELRQLELPASRDHRDSIRAVTFSADGKWIAIGGEGKVVRVWETATGEERHTFADLPRGVDHLAFDPRGHYLAGGGFGGSIQVWDLDTGRSVGSWGDCKAYRSLAFSADGKTLAALALVAIDPDGSKLALVGYEVGSGKELWRRPCERDSNGELLPGGALFAEPDADERGISLRDPATGTELARTERAASRLRLTSVVGRRFLTISGRESSWAVGVWDSATGKRLHELNVKMPRIWRAALSHDGKRVALVSFLGGAIQMRDVTTGKELHTFPGHRNGSLVVAFAADGKTVYTASGSGGRMSPTTIWQDWSLRQWDPQTGKELRVTQVDPGGEVRWTTFSPDRRFVATVLHDGTLHLWDTVAGKELRKWKVPTRDVSTNGVKYPNEAIWYPAFSPDGKSFVAASNGKIYRWNVETGDELPVVDVPIAKEFGGHFTRGFPTPDEATLLVADVQGNRTPIFLLSAASGRLLRSFGPAHATLPTCVFSPDGRTLAVADHTEVVLWEVASGRERGRLAEPNGVHGLAFSPDGKLLAVGGHSAVRLFHAASGQEVGHLDDASRWLVECLSFAPDGKRLAVAGQGNTALVCDVAALTAAKMPKPERVPAAKMDVLWNTLKGPDKPKAYRAILQLAESPVESTPFLKERLIIPAAATAKRIAQLIAELDDKDFVVRQNASTELEKLGKGAEAALNRAVEKPESEEVRLRAQRLLEKLQDSDQPSEEVINLRVLEVIENSGTPEARALLRELAEGHPDATLRQAAKAALKRLDGRKASEP